MISRTWRSWVFKERAYYEGLGGDLIIVLPDMIKLGYTEPLKRTQDSARCMNAFTKKVPTPGNIG